MKTKRKTLVWIILTFSLFLWKINVYAADASLSVSSTSVYVGDVFTVTVNVNAAAWNVHVSSSGPVAGCSINEADVSSDANDTSKSFSATCTATGTGTINISLSGDVTGASGQTSNATANRSVTVSKRPAPPSANPPAPANNPVTDNNYNNNNQPAPQQEAQPETPPETSQTPTKLPNLNITKFEIVGYNLPFNKDRYEYELDIASNVEKLYIVVEGENISAIGDKIVEINDKNEVKVKISNPEGNEKTYIITLNRKKFASPNNNQQNQIKEEKNGTSIFFYTTIGLGGLCLLLLLALLSRKNPNKTNSSHSSADSKSVKTNGTISVPTNTPVKDAVVTVPIENIATPVSGDMPNITPIGTATPVQQNVEIKEPVQEIATPVIASTDVAANASPVNPANQSVSPSGTQTSVNNLPNDVRAILK